MVATIVGCRTSCLAIGTTADRATKFLWRGDRQLKPLTYTLNAPAQLATEQRISTIQCTLLSVVKVYRGETKRIHSTSVAA
eukprot:scaffold21327_cov66-Phaeocystis_antarctica.AAC.6